MSAPRPWRISRPRGPIHDATGHVVPLASDDETKEMTCLAVNSHDELVAQRDALVVALDEAYDAMANEIASAELVEDSPLMQRLRAALSQAREVTP